MAADSIKCKNGLHPQAKCRSFFGRLPQWLQLYFVSTDSPATTFRGCVRVSIAFRTIIWASGLCQENTDMIQQTLAPRIANEGSGRLVCPPPTLQNMPPVCQPHFCLIILICCCLYSFHALKGSLSELLILGPGNLNPIHSHVSPSLHIPIHPFSVVTLEPLRCD